MPTPERGSVARPAPTRESSAARPPAADHARVLLETARQLGSSLEPDAIFARMRDSVRGAMPCNGLIVSSFDRASGLIRCAYAWVGGNLLDPATLPPLVYRPESEGMQTQVIRTGRPMIFADVAERVRDPRGTYYEVEPTGVVRDLKDTAPTESRSALMTPLILAGEVVGVLQVMADEVRAYTAADLELLEGISLLLAVALENARLFGRLQDQLEERRRTEVHLRDTESALLQADRRKDEFLATLGHELRNPLNPIRNAVELLRRKAPVDSESEWAHDVIQRQVLHLSRLIDDLLDVSRITQGKLELKRRIVGVDTVLMGAVESVRPLLDGMGHLLTIRGGPPLRVNADPVRLGQVFSNLFDNASKYTPRGGRIEVRVEREGEHVAIALRDEGRGIAAEHLPHVFDLFYQASGAGEGPGGLGIGLTLVKRLVELHGGTIEAASDGVGTGSVFTVRLPIERAEEPHPPRETAPQGKIWRMLVVDDNHDSAESMALLLRSCGHQVDVAFDGESALHAAESFRTEALVLDIGMPRMNGYEVARRLRAEAWGRDLVLVAVTGWGQERDRDRSLTAGFDAHVVKPVDHAALLRQMAEIAARRS